MSVVARGSDEVVKKYWHSFFVCSKFIKSAQDLPAHIVKANGSTRQNYSTAFYKSDRIVQET